MAQNAYTGPPLPMHDFGGQGDDVAPGVILINNDDQESETNMGPMEIPPQFPRGGYQHQTPFRQGPNYEMNTFIHKSARTSDLRPRKDLSEEFCQKAMTTYEAVTLHKVDQDDSGDKKDSKKNSKKSSWVSKDKSSKDSKKLGSKSTWGNVVQNEESFSQADIIKMIKELNSHKLSVAKKKLELAPYQQQQITRVLKEQNEMEHHRELYEWTLAQFGTKVIKNSSGKRETSAMTLYLKRAPRSNVDVISLFHDDKSHRLEKSRPRIIQDRFPESHFQQPRIQPQFQEPPHQGPPFQGQNFQEQQYQGPQFDQHQQHQQHQQQHFQGHYDDEGSDVPRNISRGRNRGGNNFRDSSQNRRRIMPKNLQQGRKIHGRRDWNRSSSGYSSESDPESNDETYGSDTTPSTLDSDRQNSQRNYYSHNNRKNKPRPRREPAYILDQPRRRDSHTYNPDVPRGLGDGRMHSLERAGNASAIGSAVADKVLDGLLAFADLAASPTGHPFPIRRIDNYAPEDRQIFDGRRDDDHYFDRYSSLPRRRSGLGDPMFEHDREYLASLRSPRLIDSFHRSTTYAPPLDERYTDHTRNPMAPRPRPRY